MCACVCLCPEHGCVCTQSYSVRIPVSLCVGEQLPPRSVTHPVLTCWEGLWGRGRNGSAFFLLKMPEASDPLHGGEAVLQPCPPPVLIWISDKGLPEARRLAGTKGAAF